MTVNKMDDKTLNHRVEVLQAAIEGVERARDVGYAIHKTSDVAMSVIRALEAKGFAIVRLTTWNKDTVDTASGAFRQDEIDNHRRGGKDGG